MAVRDRFERKSVEWTSRMLERLTPDQLFAITDKLLGVIDDVAADRWDAAVERAESIEGNVRPEKVKRLVTSFSRELGVAGAAAGAAAAAPSVGTGATLVATMSELAWFTTRAGDLVLTIAALHGREKPTVDERRAWVLAVLIYGSSARDGFARAVHEATTGAQVAASGRIPVATIQLANRVMAKTFARTYGKRRGVLAFGRLIPLGIGAVVGGGSNYLAIRALARNADEFFATLPYSAIDVESTDVTGRQLRWSR